MRKGSLKETLSFAMHGDDPKLYVVSYRDKNMVRREPLAEFLIAEEFSDIPLTRILEIRRSGELVWEKGQKELKVKTILPCRPRQT